MCGCRTRMSYLSRRAIPWVSPASSVPATRWTNRALRDFKRAFLRELKHVMVNPGRSRRFAEPGLCCTKPAACVQPLRQKQRRLRYEPPPVPGRGLRLHAQLRLSRATQPVIAVTATPSVTASPCVRLAQIDAPEAAATHPLPSGAFLAGLPASPSPSPMPARRYGRVLGTVYVSGVASAPKWFAGHGLGVSRGRSLFALEDETRQPARQWNRPVTVRRGSFGIVSTNKVSVCQAHQSDFLPSNVLRSGELMGMERTSFRWAKPSSRGAATGFTRFILNAFGDAAAGLSDDAGRLVRHE